jgi:hypothetical protein
LNLNEEETMSVVQDQYDAMLDEQHEENPGTLFANYSGSRLLKDADPVAYRCGLNDWSSSFPCVECGSEFCVDDPWNDDGVCEECSDKCEECDEKRSECYCDDETTEV